MHEEDKYIIIYAELFCRFIPAHTDMYI